MITPAYALTATERVLPRLALDFTTGVLDPRVTVTRALNTATAINSSGFIATVNADLPRFDYDPVTLQPRGLLIEEARSNLLLQSQTFETASWAKTLSTVSSNAANGPDNALTADKFIPNNGATLSGAITSQDISKAASAITYTYSVFGKSDGFDRILLRCQDSGGSVNRANVTVNVSTGAIVTAAAVAGTFTNASAKVTIYGNGYFRIELTFTSSTDTFLRSQIYALDSVASTGDGVKGILIWGAQLEAGTFATSYIPTTTTSLTRNADGVSMTGTNFSSWFNATRGAFVASFDVLRPSGFSCIYSANIGGTGYNESILQSAFSSTVDSYIYAGGIQQTRLLSGVISANTLAKTGMSYAAANFAIATNGTGLQTQLSGSLPVGMNRLQIGATPNVDNFLNGHIVKLFWYANMTNAELVAFTK